MPIAVVAGLALMFLISTGIAASSGAIPQATSPVRSNSGAPAIPPTQSKSESFAPDLPQERGLAGWVGTVDVGEAGPTEATAPESNYNVMTSSSAASPAIEGQVPVWSPQKVEGQAAPQSLSLTTSFDGLRYGNNSVGFNGAAPPDVQVAAGTSDVVEMVNLLGGIYTKSGSAVTSFTLSTFFITGSDSISDPRVLYDSASGRWFASILDITIGGFRVAVSQTSDPNSMWWIYSVNAGACADQPILAADTSIVVVSANVYTSCPSGTFKGGEYWVFSKADMMAGLAPHFQSFGPSQGLFSVHPVQNLSPTTTEYMVCSTCGNVTILSLTGVPPAQVTTTNTLVSLGSFILPPSAIQPGTSALLDTGDNRVQAAVWSRGILWFAFNDGCVPAGDTLTRSCFRLIEFNTNTTSMVQSFDVSGSQGEYVFYPALSIDGKNNLVAVYGLSSASAYPEVVTTGRTPFDPPRHLQSPPVLLRSGSGVETTSCNSSHVCRFGDYFGAGLDPSDTSVVWLAGEFGTSSGWSTTIGSTKLTTGTTFTVSYTVPGGGTGYSPPRVSYTWEGKLYTVVLTTSPVTYSIDKGGSWNVTKVLNGSTLTERWQTNKRSGTVSSSQTIVFGYYHQYLLMLSYRVSDSSVPTAPLFDGLSLGAASNQTLSSISTGYWYDSGGTWSVTDPIAGTLGERWQINTATQPDRGTVTASETLLFVYYHQFQVSFVVFPSGKGTTSPGGAGVWEDVGALSIYASPVSGYAFTGWTASGLISFSNPSSFNSTAMIGGTGTIAANFMPGVTEYVSIETSPSSSSPALVSVSGCQASISSFFANGGTVSFAADPSCSLTFTPPADTSIARYRFSPLSTTWVYTTALTGTDSVSNVLYLQDVLNCSYSLRGGGNPPPPVLSYTYLGKEGTMLTLGTTPGACYIDHATLWSVSNPDFGSTTTERWSTLSWTGVSSPGSVIAPVFFHQFLVTLRFAVMGGGYWTSPLVGYTGFGAGATSVAANDGSVQRWMDASTLVSYPLDLPGSNAAERWQAGSSPAYVVNASASFVPLFYHQYLETLSYSLVGGGAPQAPAFAGELFGHLSSQILSQSPVHSWFDGGQPWTITNPLADSSPSERWITSHSANGTLSASGQETMTFQYYHQFVLTMSFAVSSGSPIPATIRGTQSGSTVTFALSTAPTVYWFDSGSGWGVPSLLAPSTDTQRWYSNSTLTGSVVSPVSEVVRYQLQFLVQISVSGTGGGVSPLGGWYDSGSAVVLNATPASGWALGEWEGSGPSSYSGTEVTQSVIVSGPLRESAVFYPGLLLSVGPNGEVAYHWGTTQGVAKPGNLTIYVPVGTNITLSASSTSFYHRFTGFSGAINVGASASTSVVNSPETIVAKFGLNYTVIGLLIGVIGAAIIAGLVFYIKRIRRK